MTASVLRLEARLLWREPARRAALLALVTAFAFALWQGRAVVLEQRAAAVAAEEAAAAALQGSRTAWERLQAEPTLTVPARSDPRDVAAFATGQIVTHAIKPARGEAAFSIGQSDLYPYLVRLDLGPRDKAMVGEVENPHQLLVGHFDPAFVVVFLLPLLLIGAAHPIGAFERSGGGSLDAMLSIASASARDGRRYARRVVLAAFALWLPLVALTLLAVATGLLPDRPWRAGLAFLGLTVAYLAFWAGVMAVLAGRGATPARTALHLVALWAVLVMVVPGIANFTARQLSPVPPRAEFVQAMRDATDVAERERARLLDRYFGDHPELMPAGAQAQKLPAAVARLVTQREIETRMAEVEARYSAALEAQQRVLARFEWLSPPLWLQSALNRIAGTDLARQRDFESQVVAHHEALRDHFEPLILRGRAALAAGPVHFDFPRFEYRPVRAPFPGEPVGFAVLLLAVAATWGYALRAAPRGAPATRQLARRARP
ncbi:MAG: DUF3526 domain-containing protein [Pseudomonadota bacterium]